MVQKGDEEKHQDHARLTGCVEELNFTPTAAVLSQGIGILARGLKTRQEAACQMEAG